MQPPLNPPASQPLAFLSDIHGNLLALEAVLEELSRRAVVDIFVAGDMLLGGDAPLETWRRLQRAKARCIRGPSDTALVRVDASNLTPTDPERRERLRLFQKTKEELGEVVLHQISRLPDRLRLPMIDGGEVLMVHGSPADPSEPLSHDMEEPELLALLDDESADIVICGGTHVPFERPVDELTVVNVGSVGEAPEGRVAHYTIVSPRVDGAEVLQTWVEY